MTNLWLGDPHRMTDIALLHAVLRKDERAWCELSRRFRPLVYRCVARVLHRHGPANTSEDLNEVCGEVWYSLLRDDMHKLRCYDPARGARLSSWLGLLSMNAACDFLRQRARRPALLHLVPRDERLDDGLQELPAVEPSALDELLHKEQRHIMNTLLSGFSRRDRRFVELYFESGLSAEEVAESMGISVKTVYSKKNKVRVRLQALLRRHDEVALAA